MSTQQKKNMKKYGLVAAAAFIGIAALCMVMNQSQPEQTAQNESSRLVADTTSNNATTQAPEDAQASTPAPEPQPVVEVIEGTIAKGSTCSSILNTWLSKAEVYQLANAADKAFRLSKIRRGRPYRVITTDGEFTRFEYEIDADQYLSVAKSDQGFSAERVAIEYDIQAVRVDGTITSSLYEALAASGENAGLAVRIGDIFGWEIDFIRDIRKNDSFSVVVEKRYRDGEFKGYGNILAASFTNQGTIHEGYYLKDKDGFTQYYTAEGKNLRRAFLKAPLKFTRISSKYTKRRLHPILKTYRPHNGVDYAAPRGTPVSAIGNGKVIKVSRSKGAGKYVKIRHSNGYESAYLHLNRFARGLKVGKKVKQGQVIAYVGSTGLSTGPHLDFRMKKNGKYINPVKATNPRAPKATKEQLVLLKEKVRLLHPEKKTADASNGVPAA